MKGIGIYGTDSPTIKTDVDLITENVTRILLTVPGERVNNPLFGCKFKTFLFDLEVVMREEIISDMANAMAKWEPRITVNNITFKDIDSNTIAVRMAATINSNLQPFNFDQVVRY